MLWKITFAIELRNALACCLSCLLCELHFPMSLFISTPISLIIWRLNFSIDVIYCTLSSMYTISILGFKCFVWCILYVKVIESCSFRTFKMTLFFFGIVFYLHTKCDSMEQCTWRHFWFGACLWKFSPSAFLTFNFHPISIETTHSANYEKISCNFTLIQNQMVFG